MTARRLGKIIKAQRQSKGISQRTLAKRIGVTGAYITMLETGQRKNPSLAILRRIAKILGVPVTDLLQ